MIQKFLESYVKPVVFAGPCVVRTQCLGRLFLLFQSRLRTRRRQANNC